MFDLDAYLADLDDQLLQLADGRQLLTRIDPIPNGRSAGWICCPLRR